MIVEIWITQTATTNIYKYYPGGDERYFTLRGEFGQEFEFEGLHNSIEDARHYDVYDDRTYFIPNDYEGDE